MPYIGLVLFFPSAGTIHEITRNPNENVSCGFVDSLTWHGELRIAHHPELSSYDSRPVYLSNSIHIGTQNFRNVDRAICLLKVLKHRDPGAADGETGPI